MDVRIGCGSWADEEYVGVLYPKELPSGDRLAAYAKRFTSVEVNSSYYATPRQETTAKWVKQTPPGFLFDIKLHRAFSQSPENTAKAGKLVDLLLDGVKPLIRAKRLGVFLLMLDPRFTADNHRLEELLPVAKALRPHTLAVELRHKSWVSGRQKESTLAFFREHGLAWVIVDMPRISGASLLPPVYAVTDPGLAYLRLHGRNPDYLKAKSAAERHHYLYPSTVLRDIAKRVWQLGCEAGQVRVVANNHAEDFAPRTALALQGLLK